MRGSVYLFRKRRLFLAAFFLSMIWVAVRTHPSLVRDFARVKVREFLGGRFNVDIGRVSGGVFSDMVLQQVALTPVGSGTRDVFTLERMELSYRVWEPFTGKLAGKFGLARGQEYLGMFFSDNNPFIGGFLKFYKYSDKIETIGHISLDFLGDSTKRTVKGTFVKRDDGLYECEHIWDGKVRINGLLDPEGRALELDFEPIQIKRGRVSLKGTLGADGVVEIYSRVDKINIAGKELIGDFWLSYKHSSEPLFLFRAENLMLDKRPFWNFVAGGGFSAESGKVFLDNVRWGENITLVGDIGTSEPYDAKFKLMVEGLELNEVANMFTDMQTPFFGRTEMDIELEGPFRRAKVKGRIFIGEGMMGNLQFLSVSAQLDGKLPIVRIIDSRVMKERGHIYIKGEMDFSKIQENKVFENVVFETDNKVAVWEDWQISKEEDRGLVEAQKDRVTLKTNMGYDGQGDDGVGELQDLGLEYKLDSMNSIKVEIEEKKDFWGLEHKVQF